MKIKFTIPSIFVSINSQYSFSKYGRRHFLTNKARAYKNIVSLIARKTYKGKILTCPIKMEVWYYFPNKKRRDISNDKLTADALEGIIFVDDKQINNLHLHKEYNPGNPRTEIIITG